ncbi:FAD-binding oxidoreductase [Acidisoma cellulosilytica]|uniref:FAD-binding oxidoreductase n=1 Tax=Acidisoma cellulosilyticum TaxID=2802395 RepID=A0A963YXD4_9PROT|nr:FAD-binding oxidoreductase [Acidisoma cellulosilyticum]MCB8878871.1 FAD-binding oxidoreductase [Acidisoma cellulosilyticum]
MIGLNADLLDRFSAIVGARHALRDQADQHAFLEEPRDRYHGKTAIVLRPKSTAEVQQILQLAHDTRTAIVPQGGNTGLVGGQIPDGSGLQVVLSLTRLNAIRAIDPISNTIDVEAGVTLQRVRETAEAADRLFALSLASEGSCTIGGNIGTNAGGTSTIAYGNMRDLVLGLEVVLADGSLWRDMRHLRKDNTGYDFRGLFVGSEGTLGIVTAAVLKLYPRPRSTATAFAAVRDPAAALALLQIAQADSRAALVAFELIPRLGMELAVKHDLGSRDPLATAYPWYVLLELTSGAESGLNTVLEELLGDGMEQGLIEDAALASSMEQAKALWRPRESMSEVQGREGGSIKHDVSIPVADVAAFIAEATAAVEAFLPDARVLPFGHVGDGNIHFNISQPAGGDKDAFLAHWEDVNAIVHDIVARYHGSISAEHGIGQSKLSLLPQVKDKVAMQMMYATKQMLDPKGILNPGKLLL